MRIRGTERILEAKKRKAQLIKSRVYGIVMTLIAISLGAGLFITTKELKEVKTMNSSLIEANQSLDNEIAELQSEVVVLEEEVKELNSLDNKLSVIASMEDIVREAVSGIESTSGYIASTDVKYTDYVLNDKVGQTVKVIETKNNMYVTYICNNESVKSLNQQIWNQYYLGTEKYLRTILNTKGVILVKHEPVLN